MKLQFTSQGSGNPRLCFVHGFTQTGNSWKKPASGIHGATKIFIDAPDHGASQGVSLNLVEAGNAVAEISAGSTVIGYSMGARIALHAVLQHPDAFTGAVLVSGTAGISDDQERIDRKLQDEALACSIEDKGSESFIREWVQQPLFANSFFGEEEIADRMRNTATSLASSLRLCGTGSQQPLWGQLKNIRIPVLIVAGELDKKFVGLAEQMHSLIPTSEIAVVPNAGHAVHTETPSSLCEIVNEWLDSQTNSKQ